jgi:D-alanyl-lipoteichoic acid acyltransferase DltB (MBOAT superfamily)
LVQKNVIANVLGIWVERGFAVHGGDIPSTVDGWFLAIAFALQIYFDFAGYTNLAIGTARLIGIMLPENFRFPYHAASPPEFWNHWHMSLSRWIRDYLFFPVNAKWKGAPLPLYLSLIGVMALVGLWHGAGWTYILWGTLHGILLMLYRAYDRWREACPALKNSRWVSGTWRFLTLGAITVAWVPFRAASISQAGSMLAALLYRFSSARHQDSMFYVFTIVIGLFCVIEPTLMAALDEIEGRAGTTGPSMFRVFFRPLAYLLGLVLFFLFDENNTQFIYSQF